MVTTLTSLQLDRFLPEFHTTLIETRVVDAPQPEAYRLLRNLDFAQIHSPLMDAAMWVRGVPERIAEAAGRDRPEVELVTMRLGDMFLEEESGLPGWVGLAEVPDHEIVMGAVGAFWKPVIDWIDVPAAEFAAFADPEYGKIGAGFTLSAYGEQRTLVTYEARTWVPDPAARRRFLFYWHLIRPFVGVIMRAMLKTLEEEAQKTSSP